MKFSNRKPLKVFYLLGVTLLLLLWLEQRSINAYWVQTYHKTSPLAVFDNYVVWRAGGEIASYLGIGLEKIEQHMADFNDSAVSLVNKYLYLNPEQQPPAIEQSLLINTDLVLKGSKPLIFPQRPFFRFLKLDETTKVQDEPLSTHYMSLINKGAAHSKALAADNAIVLDKGQKVFFVGDSLMQGVAPHAMRILLKQHNIESINLSKQSTGLAYPRFFNWPQVAKDTFAKNPEIKLMVVFMGPNDPWDFPLVKGGKFVKFASSEWEGVYRARIQTLINAATSHGAQVLWIGAPNMKDKKLNDGVITLNKIYKSQVTIAKQHYVISNDVLGMKDDKFVKFMNMANKGNVTLRTDDGIHFTTIGQKLIADKIISLLHFNEATETTE